MQFDRFRFLVSRLAVVGLVLGLSIATAPASASPVAEEVHTHGQHPSVSAPRRAAAAEEPPVSDAEKDTEAQPQGEDDGEDADKEKDEWSVDNAPGPMREIAIQVTEGTWMSLDVSPDGTTIVFDLLGDLYEMPIEGGQAAAITAGVSWDMQPRYSPDGSKIAFTSDRSGGDNLWVMQRNIGEPSIFANMDLEAREPDEAEMLTEALINAQEEPDGTDDSNSIPGVFTGWSKPTAVTKETYRLVNSPTWTPDSQFIAGHKHFTSRRSLGSGEVWLYHWTGGDGLQMVEKPNEQKDLGEPAFSPDGRYLYYSQDTTPGSTFEYNKDSNGQIYTIQRLDREDGRVERFVGGPGGAIRPTPSPDGKLLAFVKRVRFESVLFLHDLESGEEWPIYDGMERDMQETWAIHGVYPTIAWTPDSASIVFWAGGKIHKIAARGANSQATEIPFSIDDTRTIYDHVLTPQTAWEESFDVKMLRWVKVSPDGSKVLFQALGYIWIKDLSSASDTADAAPERLPKRLTTQSDHFEFYPAWSADGQRVVYTTWDDRELGSVRVATLESAASGSRKKGRGAAKGATPGSVVVTPDPGHYVEPAFSPDGNSVVYRKVEGGYLRSPLWSKNPGIYVASVSPASTASRLVTRDGYEPFFEPAGMAASHAASADTRIFFTARGDKDARLLKSIAVDGSDERTHLESEAATEFAVSPDGEWIAFRERFNAFISPFPATGKTVSIGPKSTALPLAKVNSDAGEYLHWSGDSQRLHWALGPELFTRELKDAFAFLADPTPAGAPTSADPDTAEEQPEPPGIGAGVPIGFSQAADVPEGTIAFTGARVVTMTSEPSATDGDSGILENGTVVVEGNRIVAVGGANTPIPDGAHVVDASGKTILPGLVDIHYHGAAGSEQIIPQQNWFHYAGLAFGVTTTHDPSNDTAEVFATSELAQAGGIVAPRVFSTGTILYGASGSFRAEIDSLEDARYHLKRLQAAGAFSVKSYNQPRRDQRQQVLTAARELGMLVYPEGGSTFMHNLTQIVDGHTTIEHSIPVANIYDDVKSLWREAKVGYTPTLVVGYGGLWGEEYWYAKTNVWENERLMTFVPREIVDPRARRRSLAPYNEWNHFANAKICQELSDLGVDVLIGAHGQREGLGAHWEIWMLVQGGMTPYQALYSATLEGARELGMDSDLGSLEPGKLADLVVIDGNPLDDIRSSENVSYTMVNGRLYDAATMNEVGNRERERGAFWWEGGR